MYHHEMFLLGSRGGERKCRSHELGTYVVRKEDKSTEKEVVQPHPEGMRREQRRNTAILQEGGDGHMGL